MWRSGPASSQAWGWAGRLRWERSRLDVSPREAVPVTHRVRACSETDEPLPGTLALSTALLH